MQEHIWEREYRNPRLVSGSIEPQASVKDFLRFVRREQKLPLENLNVLDLGCGNGKNSIYIAGLDGTNEVTGIDISETALTEARKLAYEAEVDEQTEFMKQSIGVALPFPSESFDLILDVTSSNSLSEAERTLYLNETHRVLKSSGFLFVRALCKDGDKNAQTLLKMSPGKEHDTYIMPEIGLTERVFSKEDFMATYSATPAGQPLFNILHLEKETHYTKIGDRSYKRNFWIAYCKKI